MEKCLNCGNLIEHEYCGYCGQQLETERITFSYLWHDAFHFFTHIEKGFVYTTLRMIVDPGSVVIGYVEGKRKKYQTPISYFLIWTSIFILTLYLFVKTFGEQSVIDYKDYFGPGMDTPFAISNLSMMLAFIVPVQALHLFLTLMRPKYNYFESLVMAVYAVGTIIFLQFVFALLSLLIFSFTQHPADLRFSDLFKVTYLVWFTWSVLHQIDYRHKLIRGILFVLLAVGTFTVWRLFGVPLIASWFVHS